VRLAESKDLIAKKEADALIEVLSTSNWVEQRFNRTVWATTQCYFPFSSAVSLLLGKWGGEAIHDAAYLVDGSQEGRLVGKLAKIGGPVIFELHIPYEGLDPLSQKSLDAGTLEGDIRIKDGMPSEWIKKVIEYPSSEYMKFGEVH